MMVFTPRPGRYLAFIHAYRKGYGVPPSQLDISEAMGVSPPSVHQMMKTLEKKGLIRVQRREARSTEILLPEDDIPNWDGPMVPRIVREWVLDSSKPRLTNSTRGDSKQRTSNQGDDTVFRFKISLRGSEPPIWRRIETKDVELAAFHEQIQTAMGWTNSHLHQFKVDGERYTDPRFTDDGFAGLGAISYQGLMLSDFIKQRRGYPRILYEYDFGDGWEHEIVLESVAAADPAVRYPRCVAGRRACPPEDVGGIWGFARFVEAITNPEHEEHEDYLEWSGPFDPTAFDMEETTQMMREGLPSW